MPPGAGTFEQSQGFGGNHPHCPSCQAPARPAVLMFGDFRWEDVEEQDYRFQDWLHHVKKQVQRVRKSGLGATEPLKVAVLEIGAGKNVPTVRSTSESQVRMFHHAGAEANLIRVNPEF